MKVYVGTSGWSYAPWKGVFYPEDLPSSKMLAYYAARFSSVEVNNTFYRMPTAKTVSEWAAQVPPTFTFAVKAPQRITHQKRLKDDAADATEAFVRATDALGERRGPLVFQLPPNFKKDAPRLEAFLARQVPAGSGARIAFEFRHASWFDDETFGILRAAGAALCTAEGEEITAPFLATAPFGYLRLRLPEYTDAALAEWAERILAQPWSVAWVYLKHEDEARGPDFAARLVEKLGASAAVTA